MDTDLSKKPEGAAGLLAPSPIVLLLEGLKRICAFQSPVSRNKISMGALRRTGWRVHRFMKRCKDHARRCVNSVLNLSPLTYAMLFFSGKGGIAHAW